MIKDERNNKLKIVVIHGVSAIFIVLLWFMLYYFFQNHGWQCSSKLRIDGCKGYVDFNVWFEGNTFRNKLEEIPVEYNPFEEPIGNVTLGTMGEAACWVRWYLWRFGMFGNVDSSVVYGSRLVRALRYTLA